MFPDRSRKASFTRSQRADSPAASLPSVCVLNSRVNSPGGKDTTIGESRAGGRRACLKMRAAHGPGAQRAPLTAEPLPQPLADANPGRQQNCAFGTVHCTNPSHEQSLTRPEDLDGMSELGRHRQGQAGRRIGFLGHHLSPLSPG